MKNRGEVLLIVLLVVLFSCAGIWMYFRYRTQIILKRVVVGPKWVNQAQFAGMFTAKERGFYQNRGLDVSFKEFSDDTDRVDDLMKKRTDFTLMSAEEFLHYRSEGVPIKAIAAFYQISPLAVVSLSEKMIESPADLKGKKLGNKGGKMEEKLIYDLLLSSVGLREADVNTVKLGFDHHELDDLREGRSDTVDLYRTDQLYLFDKAKVDYEIIYPELFGINIFNDILVVREELAEADPEVIRDFLAATVQGWEQVLLDPSGAVEETLKYVTAGEYKDRDYQRYILEQSLPLIKPDANSVMGMMTYFQWNRLYEQMVQSGLVKGGLSVERVFTIEFLP